MMHPAIMDWSISPLQQTAYDKYFILHYRGDYLFKCLLDNYGCIYKDNVRFICKSYDIRSSMAEIYANPEAQFALSFRRESGKHDGIVLIKRMFNHVTN
jgi:hypothetical protein